jgi:hypothetical protein
MHATVKQLDFSKVHIISYNGKNVVLETKPCLGYKNLPEATCHFDIKNEKLIIFDSDETYAVELHVFLPGLIFTFF